MVDETTSCESRISTWDINVHFGLTLHVQAGRECRFETMPKVLDLCWWLPPLPREISAAHENSLAGRWSQKRNLGNARWNQTNDTIDISLHRAMLLLLFRTFQPLPNFPDQRPAPTQGILGLPTGLVAQLSCPSSGTSSTFRCRGTRSHLRIGYSQLLVAKSPCKKKETNIC